MTSTFQRSGLASASPLLRLLRPPRGRAAQRHTQRAEASHLPGEPQACRPSQAARRPWGEAALSRLKAETIPGTPPSLPRLNGTLRIYTTERFHRPTGSHKTAIPPCKRSGFREFQGGLASRLRSSNPTAPQCNHILLPNCQSAYAKRHGMMLRNIPPALDTVLLIGLRLSRQARTSRTRANKKKDRTRLPPRNPRPILGSPAKKRGTPLEEVSLIVGPPQSKKQENDRARPPAKSAHPVTRTPVKEARHESSHT